MSLDAPKAMSVNAKSFSFGLVAASYNPKLVDGLLEQVYERLREAGAKKKNVYVVRVPGSAELPFAVSALARRYRLDCAVALGVLIRGDTIHYELIASSVTDALQAVALDQRLPVINGVVVAENQSQAEDRCLGKINRAAEFAQAALKIAELRRALLKP